MSHGNTARRKYVVGFTVHEAKELNKDGVAIDPLFVVRAVGKEFKTDIKRGKIQHAKFEEGHIWNDIYLTEDEFNMSFIDFELQAACVFTRNEVVGSARVQLAMVRKRGNHTIVGKWLQLTNAHESTAKVRATIFCYGEGDAPPGAQEITNDEEEAAAHHEDLRNAVLDTCANKQAPLQTGQSYHLFVQVHRAEDLGGGDKLYNPYVTVEFNGTRLASQHVVDTNKLNFEEQFRMPVQTPLHADAIVIRIWSKNKWGADEMIVQGRLSFSLIRMHAMPPQWFTFYGFSSKEVPDVEQICGAGELVEENSYQGRLLISSQVCKVRRGGLLKAAVVHGGAFEEPASAQMALLADVQEVTGVEGTHAYVSLSLGRQAKKTKTIKKEDEELSFKFSADEVGRMPPLTSVVPVDPKNQMDVILSVYVKGNNCILGVGEDGFQRVGFVRIKLSDIREGNGDIPRWIVCRPMAHLPSSVKPGAVLLSLTRTSQVSIKDRPKPEIKRLPFVLRCYVCMARGLTTETKETPKAFCEVSCAGKVARTKTMEDPTSAPRWAECLTMPIELQYSVQHSRVYPEPIQLIVYDEVEGTSLQDRLNRVYEGAKGVASEVAQSEDKLGKIAAHGENAMSNFENQEEFGIKMQRGVQDLFGAISDTVGAMSGDVMAKKRVGAVVSGRRLIGRANIHFNSIVKPPGEDGLTPRWVKLKGGMMGSSHAGDILVGFEMLKPKYASKATCNNPIEAKAAAPRDEKRCVLSLAIAGLRGVKVPEGYGSLEKPRLEISVSSFKKEKSVEEQLEANSTHTAGESEAVVNANGKGMLKGKNKGKGSDNSIVESGPSITEIKFSRKPPEGQEINKDDYNRKWTVNGVSGWEFLRVVHLEVSMPRLAVWEPDVRIRLLDEKGRFVAEGRLSLADRLPWDSSPAAKSRAYKSMQAQDDWPADADHQDDDGGIPVSDEEDDICYKIVEYGNEPCQIRFTESDSKSFPPAVEALAKTSAARKAGVKAGDWLVGYSQPGEKEKPTGHWTPAQAATFIKDMDDQRVRPLKLRFRRKCKGEITVRLMEGKTLLDFEADESVRPPKIELDKTADGWWKKQGINKGWCIVDINGFDCQSWHGKHSMFQKLLQMRPIVVTCRGGQPGSTAAEREVQLKAKVMLNGLPSNYLKAYEHKLKPSQSCLSGTVVPRCTAMIPPVAESRAMNLLPARDGCLDIRGKPVHIVEGSGDDADERARPSVDGMLEDVMERPEFQSVLLSNGPSQVGILKLAYTVKCPVPFTLDWTSATVKTRHRAKDRDKDKEDAKGEIEDPERELFDEQKLRRRFKVGQPAKFRVRTYITRGLSVSGAVQGVGNPFLYFSYGNDIVKLEGRRKLNTSEPRFFTTEERDIQLPDQALFEVGLYDWQEYGEPAFIGKTVIDLEDRWFTKDYQEYTKRQQVPIEYRPLLSGAEGSLCKGSLEMWVELLDAQDAAEIRKSPLFQPPPVEVELRIVVWTVRSMSLRLCVDEYGDERGRADVLARCQLSCGSYLGPQPADQETDIHYGSEGEAEFNWRFVYSRVAVTKGVPLACHIQLSLWEHFALKRPVLLCENLMDMKNYCTRVARTRDTLEIESEVPLNNRLLTRMLQEESDSSKWDDVDDDGESSAEEEATELKPHGHAEKSEGADMEIPPAALVKILVQVVPQTEASDQKVGMRRDDPNHNPVLSYPKTGRNWQHALPTAVNIISNVIQSVQTGKRRLCYTSILVTVVLIIFLLHYVKNPMTGCPYIQSSCKQQGTCAACACCHHKNEPPVKFCYYSFLGNSKCGVDPYASVCNMVGTTCELPIGCLPTASGTGGTCMGTPAAPVANINAQGR